MLRFLSLASLTAWAAVAPAQSPPLLMSDVAVGVYDIAFVWGGQIWRVPRIGGVARRWFTDDVSRVGPVFSPDGRQLAFTRVAGGDLDVFVVPTAGGESKRITYHPKMDLTRAWTPDGKGLLFVSDREQDGSSELYTIGLNDPMERRLPIPAGVYGCFSPDGTRLLYAPRSIFYTNVNRRFYRGGSTAPLWILDLKTKALKEITDGKSSAISPMWVGDRIYFATDRVGSFNLAEYDSKTGKTRELTHFATKGITSAAYGGGAIAYIRDGRIYLFDVAKRTTTPVEVRLDSAELAARDERVPRAVPIPRFINEAHPSNDGKQVTIEARGEALRYDIAGKTAVNLTKTAGSAERNATLSPDGKQVAYFSDASGEYRLCVRDLADGSVRTIDVEAKPTFYRELEWSPDGRRIAFSDQRLSLWCVDLSNRQATKVDTSTHLAQGRWHPRWSPDGAWLTYAKALPTRVRNVFLWEASSGRRIPVSDGISHDENPVFDRSGRFLYFTTSANGRNASAADIGWALMSSIFAEPTVTKGLCVVVLRKGDSLLPVGGTETRVDADGLSRRILPTPMGGRDILGLEAGASGSVIVHMREAAGNPFDGQARTSLHRVDVAARRRESLAENVDDFEVSRDGTTALISRGPQLLVLPTAAPSTPAPLDLEAVRVDVEPRVEWGQIYHEAWRMMRDTFYDPNYHGQDPVELERHYAAYLPGITRRSDLNALLVRAFGEISISHLRVSGGDSLPAGPSTIPPSRVGMLGADFTVDANRYRVASILPSGPYGDPSPLLRSPLDQPGVDVRVGDYLIEVDGRPVNADRSLYAAMMGTAGRPTKLKVAASPGGEGAREVTVIPLAGENTLRSAARIRRNEETVRRLSGGRLAYVYLAAHDEQYFNEFFRVLNGSGDRQGLVIDQRFNGGGITADMQIDALLRQPRLAYAYRYGDEIVIPAHRIAGPKVLITNEANGSAAETFALMFRTGRVGPIVGMATYGGGIGTALYSQRLVDGGVVGIPNRAGYDPLSGRWVIENEGVPPDYRIDVLPADYAAGRDPQLEKAVAIALAAIPRYPKERLKRPVPPVHPGGR